MFGVDVRRGWWCAEFCWCVVLALGPTTPRSVGSRLGPVMGVCVAGLFSGGRPGLTDVIGFALIFAAAACVLLQRDVKHDELPE